MTRRAAQFFLKVWASNRQAYAQVIESSSGRVGASASTMEKAIKNSATAASSSSAASTSTSTSQTSVASNSVASCAEAGVRLAQRAAAAGVSSSDKQEGGGGAAWRRSHGQRYHGRVASLLGAAREAGLRLL